MRHVSVIPPRRTPLATPADPQRNTSSLPTPLARNGCMLPLLYWLPQLALQMVGNMKSPISRKNRARSWEEIRRLIVDLRREVGIDL